jgi:hypothetical protein
MKSFYSERKMSKAFSLLFSTLAVLFAISIPNMYAQSEVDGAFKGIVKDADTGSPIAGARVVFRNRYTNQESVTISSNDGTFSKTALPPAEYDVEISAPGYAPLTNVQKLYTMDYYQVEPFPFNLAKVAVAVNPTPVQPGNPSPTPAPTAQAVANNQEGGERLDLSTRLYRAFDDRKVTTYPLGSRTLTRTFDDLALLLPGVTLPPLTIGNGSGPGQGAGVGSAGQFSVNGMRSRSNNFTVDGSDNNDADIGVRRQGFFALVPQPIESIQEYQVTTLLAPAQFGRNFGGQINAISKSGGNRFHGTIFGFFNNDRLNARNAFDTTNGNSTTGVTAHTTYQGTTYTQAVILDEHPLTVTNQSGGEDPFKLWQGGFVLGGPIKRDKAFFFVSFERDVLNARKEGSFAVPTVEQRGIFGTGATGIFADCLTGGNVRDCRPDTAGNYFPEFGYPTSVAGDAIFSFFPFPNNPNGIYGRNTYTASLPADARGTIASGKYDQNFTLWNKPQNLTARYNFTQDNRDLPTTGDAIFSALRPDVRTQNFSTILTSRLSNVTANVLRLSYGRTRLKFEELRDPFLLDSQVSPGEPFLLNARRIFNNTLTPDVGLPNLGDVLYGSGGTTECGILSLQECRTSNFANDSPLGRVGQVNIAGFSPVGVDVNNFPQKRVNNTYQIGDFVSHQHGRHSLVFGEDIRRVELNSDLPRNSRTILSFNGAPELDCLDPECMQVGFSGEFVRASDFAAAGAPSGAFLSLQNGGSSAIGLRYYEIDFFGQDTLRIRPNLTVNFGLRYEYNTVPQERHNVIESTFSGLPILDNPNAVGLKTFVAGRTKIFDADKNNFEPRVGLAWSPYWFGANRQTVIRLGFGVYHDQILGSVVSQSRNVFPNFITVNTGASPDAQGLLSVFNPAVGGIRRSNGIFYPLVEPGTLNTLNSALPLDLVLDCFAGNAGGTCNTSILGALQATLPERSLKTPSAEQYMAAWEQQIWRRMVLSVTYVGTRGHNLLRTTTPNLGPNFLVLPFAVFAGNDPNGSSQPSFLAGRDQPGFGRPVPGIGSVTIYDSGGRSNYDALQMQLRGRFMNRMQFQLSYTESRSKDDASDVFDLAGSPALPQNSLTRTGEYAPSNFDTRHRFTYDFIYDIPADGHGDIYNAIFRNMQFASTGYMQSGQPFTINSMFDVNLDGNLTDRPTGVGINRTGIREHPYDVVPGTPTSLLLAAPGQDSSIGRNAYRAGDIINFDLSLIKDFFVREDQRISFRMDIFNFLDRKNYGIPVRVLEAPSFGAAVDTVTPGRRIQFGLKYMF